ncbi:hypothetical protein [Enterovibrio norvegicus]|uniref:hypothetical protein n=1 Tax=Enterovibrio norvegicus TaxID=188144 RepID=UPI00354CC356
MEQLKTQCENCAADQVYLPGTKGLSCNYCGHFTEFKTEETAANEANEELCLSSYLESYSPLPEEQIERHIVKCSGCGAQPELEENQESGNCPFCDSPIVVGQAQSKKLIKPQGLLAFDVSRSQARESFSSWLKGLWFAPNSLQKQITQHEKFKGIYLPYWTYDCETKTQYRGQRGDDYYETVTRQNSDGESVSEQVRKTRWRSVRGEVYDSFDDVLVPATHSLPRKMLYELEPWDLNNVVDYKEEYLSGYVTESYQVDLKEGFIEAKDIMKPQIERTIHRDIGGDRQQITSTQTQFSKETFKHLLCPVWVSAYRHKGELYQILVNARTGEIQGERPYSWVKIGLTALSVAALVGIGVYFYQVNAGPV